MTFSIDDVFSGVPAVCFVIIQSRDCKRVSGQVFGDSNIAIYTLPEPGVALQATVAVTKYWKDKELNRFVSI